MAADIEELIKQYGGTIVQPEAPAAAPAGAPTGMPTNQAPTPQAAPAAALDINELIKQFGGTVVQPAPSDVPQLDATGQLIQPSVAPPPAPPTFGEKLAGAGEAALMLGTGATTGMMGGARGLAEGLMQRIMNDKLSAYEGAKLMGQTTMQRMAEATYMPTTEMGREYAQRMGETLGMVPPVIPMAPELAAAGRMAAGAPLVAKTAQQAERAAQRAETALTEAATQAPETAGRAMATLADIAMPERRAEIARMLREEPDNPSVAQFRLVNDQVRPDREAADVLKQGWKEGVVGTIKAASDEDRQRMLQMLNIYKEGKKSEKFRALKRPADILGQSLEERANFLLKTRRSAGKEIEKAANDQLRGNPVNYQDAMNKFISDLNQIGVKVGMDQNGIVRADLRNSDIQGDVAGEALLNRVLERLSDVNAPDAYGVHTAKRFIDTQVSYGKRQQNPLTAQAERIVKGLRYNLNESLKNQFPEYGAANTKYSEATDALDNLQSAVGKNIDLEGKNVDKAFGTAMRRVVSNYGNRVNMIDSLDQVNQVAQKYGMPIKNDLINQMVFVNELDRMFGAPASGTFKGQISEALKTGLDIVRGGAAQKAMDLAAAGLEKASGINEDNAIKTIEQLLKRKTGQPEAPAAPGQSLAPLQ